jgi:tetratricopeptide (TPR) repeat protein
VREYQPLRPLKPQTPRRCGPATAAAAGLPEPAWELVGCLTSFLLLRSYWASLDAVQERALAACRQAFNRRGEAAIRCARGGHLTEAGHATMGLTQGEAMLVRALAIFLDLDDERGQAKALHALSALERRVGRHQRPAQLASALDHSDQGRLEEAEALLAAATDLWPSQVQGPGFRAQVLDELGRLRTRQVRYGQAIGHLAEAASLWQQLGAHASQARTLTMLGDALATAGRSHQAHTARQQARALQQHDPGARHVGA